MWFYCSSADFSCSFFSTVSKLSLDLLHFWVDLSYFTPFTTNSHNDQIENRGKDGYGKSVGYIPPKGWIYPVFLEFADQMENLGKDGVWELSVLATCGWIRSFVKFTEKKRKFEVKITYGNFGYYSLVTWMLRIYPVFLEFTDQMVNRGKSVSHLPMNSQN